jgi:hypothetical protein
MKHLRKVQVRTKVKVKVDINKMKQYDTIRYYITK